MTWLKVAACILREALLERIRPSKKMAAHICGLIRACEGDARHNLKLLIEAIGRLRRKLVHSGRDLQQHRIATGDLTSGAVLRESADNQKHKGKVRLMQRTSSRFWHVERNQAIAQSEAQLGDSGSGAGKKGQLSWACPVKMLIRLGPTVPRTQAESL